MGIKIERKTVPDVEVTVELFELNGESYHVPARPRPNVALKYLRMVREVGEAGASAYLLEALLGKSGFEAMSNYDDLTPDEFKSVMRAARELTMSSVEADKS